MEGFEMGKVKVLTARQAADLIKDGDTVTLSGFVANGIAEALNAEKLVFLTDIEGVFVDPEDKSTLISEMDLKQAKEFIDNGVVGGGMLPKLKNCIEAIEGGVSRVHILDGRLTNCLLLEFFTEKGIGTAILKEPLFDKPLFNEEDEEGC